MGRVNLTVHEKEIAVLNVNEALANYTDMMSVLKAYIDELLKELGVGACSVVFCAELPTEGEKNYLYIDTTNLKAYIWDGAWQELTSTCDGECWKDDVATDKEVDEALDDALGSPLASDEELDEALEDVFKQFRK